MNKKIIEPKVIVIELSTYWEKRDKSWDEDKVTEREYTTQYHGGWTITGCKGHPEINGGYATPDFDETPASLRRMFMDRYSNVYKGGNKVIVKLKITRDDRNPTMESFF